MDKNVFEMLGVEKREISYSNFLAWLMDPNLNGDVDEEFLKRFLELEDLKLGETEYDLSSESIEVCREVPKSTSEADIVVFSDEFQLVIENKVKSREGKEQTPRLHDDWSGLDKDEIFVYLTPEYRDGPESDYFDHVTYTSIRDILQEMDRSDFGKRAKIMIEDFKETLEVNDLVEFDGFREESIEYMEKMKEIGKKRKVWRNQIEDLFNEVKKRLKEKNEIDSEWDITTKTDKIVLKKEAWDEGFSLQCKANESALRNGCIKFRIYAENDLDDRENRWKNFKENIDELDNTTKYKWVYRDDEDLFEKLTEEKENFPEIIEDEIIEYIDKYGGIIDEI